MGTHANYIQLLKEIKQLARPYDAYVIKALKNKLSEKLTNVKKGTQEETDLLNLKAFIEQINTKIGETGELLNKSLEQVVKIPLPDDERAQIIRDTAKIYQEAVTALKSELKEDLETEQQANEFAMNFLQNALGQAGLQDENGGFYLDMIKVYDEKDPVKAFDELATKRVTLARKEKLLKYLDILGETYFTEKILEAYKNNPNGQNELANLIKEDFSSLNVDQTLSPKEQKLKKILVENVFDKISLERNTQASQLRELTGTVNHLIKDMQDLSSAAIHPMLASLEDDDRAKLELFLAPYKMLAELGNPFPAFDEQAADAVGLKTVLTITGDKYIGENTAEKKEQAQQYITHLQNELSTSLIDTDTNVKKFLDLTALCMANQSAFAYFVRDMKVKYGIDQNHPLFRFCEKCDTSNSQSLTIKPVQTMPRLMLLSRDIYPGKENGEQKEIPSQQTKAFIDTAAKGNGMELPTYINHPVIQETLRDNPNKSYHETAFLIPDTQITIKQFMKKQLTNFKPENDDQKFQLNNRALLLNMLVSCRKYYSLDLTHPSGARADKAKLIVNGLNSAIDSVTNGNDTLKALGAVAEQLKSLSIGSHRTLIHRIFHVDDTLTKVLKDTFKVLEKADQQRLKLK